MSPRGAMRRHSHAIDGRNEVRDAHDPVGGLVAGARGHADAEGPDVHADGFVDDVLDHRAREDDARVGARLPGRVERVLPRQRRGVGHALDVEEHERRVRVDDRALEARVLPVFAQVVHANEPTILGVGHIHAPVALLDGRVAQRHVVGAGGQVRGLAERDVVRLAVDDVGAEQDAAVVLAAQVLVHLGLAAARRALVHDDGLVVVRGRDANGRRVGGDPAVALLLADVEQDGEDALLGARARVQVVGEDLVKRLRAVVDHHLLVAEVRLAERRRHVDDRARGVVAELVEGDPAGEVADRQREESGVDRDDRERGRPELERARLERHDHELLRAEPVEGLLPHGREGLAELLRVPVLVRGEVVGDVHALRVAAAHVVLWVVHRDAVAAADDGGFDDGRAVRLVLDAEDGAAFGAEGELVELLARLGHHQARTRVERGAYLWRQRDAVKDGLLGCGGHGASFSAACGCLPTRVFAPILP